MSSSEGATETSSKTTQSTCESQPQLEEIGGAAERGNDAASSSPFDDPIQRTKWLIRYIRLRKRRAEDEIAKQNELKRKKKDARATLQNARTNLKSTEEEVKRCEQRMEELNADRHRIFGSLKEVLSREEERKRQREAERMQAAKLEEQQRLQQQAMEMATLQQQVKNSQLLSLLTGLFTTQADPAARGATSYQQQQVSTAGSGVASAHHPHYLQQQQQPQTAQPPQISPSALLDAPLFQNMQQQQNQLNAAFNFLRQHQAASGGSGNLLTAPALPQSIPSPALIQAASRPPPQSQQQNASGNNIIRPQQAVTPNTAMLYHTLLAGMMAGKPLPNSTHQQQNNR